MTTAPDRRADPGTFDGGAVVFACLRGDADYLEQHFGGDPSRIAGDVRKPFPRLRVRRLPGGQEALLWRGWHDVRLTAYDDPEGSHDEQTLVDMLTGALRLLVQLTARRTPIAGVIVTGVDVTNGIGPGAELGRASAVWACTVRIGGHPDPDAGT